MPCQVHSEPGNWAWIARTGAYAQAPNALLDRLVRGGTRALWRSLSKRLIARALWDYAEDAHVQRALDLTEDEHAKVQHICAWYDLPEYPLPVSGQRITNNHVCALAAITLFEGSVRPLAQTRRRPAKSCPPALQD